MLIINKWKCSSYLFLLYPTKNIHIYFILNFMPVCPFNHPVWVLGTADEPVIWIKKFTDGEFYQEKKWQKLLRLYLAKKKEGKLLCSSISSLALKHQFDDLYLFKHARICAQLERITTLFFSVLNCFVFLNGNLFRKLNISNVSVCIKGVRLSFENTFILDSTKACWVFKWDSNWLGNNYVLSCPIFSRYVEPVLHNSLLNEPTKVYKCICQTTIKIWI